MLIELNLDCTCVYTYIETKSFTNNTKHFEMSSLVLQRETSITIVVAKFETNLSIFYHRLLLLS